MIEGMRLMALALEDTSMLLWKRDPDADRSELCEVWLVSHVSKLSGLATLVNSFEI